MARARRVAPLLTAAVAAGAVAGVAVAAPGDTELVSVDNSGQPSSVANHQAQWPQVSADGMRVVFSADGDLTPGSESGRNLYLRDRAAGTIARLDDDADLDAHLAATAPLGSPGSRPAISADGQAVAWESSVRATSDIFFRAVGGEIHSATNTPTLLANGSSTHPSLSGNGRVAFQSSATNLVTGDTNARRDILVADVSADPPTFTRVNIGASGAQATDDSSRPAISADGTVVVFESEAPLVPADTDGDKVDVYIRDLSAGTTALASVNSTGAPITSGCCGESASQPDISADGRYVVFTTRNPAVPEDPDNNSADVYRYDRQTGAVVLVSRTPAGDHRADAGTHPAISGDGSRVAYSTLASTLTTGSSEVYVKDLATGWLAFASQGPDGTGAGESGNENDSIDIAGNGSTVVFETDDKNIVSPPFTAVSEIAANELLFEPPPLPPPPPPGDPAPAPSGDGAGGTGGGGSTPPPAPGSSLPEFAAGGLLMAQRELEVTSRTLTVPMHCAPQQQPACTGNVVVRSAAKLRLRIPAPAVHAARRKPARRVVLGSARFSIPAASSRDVSVRLTRTGRKALRRKTLKARVTVVQDQPGGGSQTSTRTVKLRRSESTARVKRNSVKLRVLFPADADERRRAELTLLGGSAVLGRAETSPTPGRSKNVRIKLGKKAVRKRRTRATLQTSYTTMAGAPKTVQRSVVLTKGRR